jgi:hypothetical protein
MPLTPRLAGIIAAMIDAKLDAEARWAVASRVTMPRARCSDRSVGDQLGYRRRGRP